MAARAEAVLEERRRTEAIAELGVKARAAGVRMAPLASFVQVMGKDGKLRPVTRQAVDLMLAAHTGRERHPMPHQRRARPEDNGHQPQGVNLDAFG